jgi:hypothetical protein
VLLMMGCRDVKPRIASSSAGVLCGCSASRRERDAGASRLNSHAGAWEPENRLNRVTRLHSDAWHFAL